ncbi:MAG: radical SAM family heme chaperone HemW, partial [Desulfosalsimonadaceae bacterium]|nr:radical SAM family heme chaperone HemW [Desulfosalsimonadaceae bacterium]
TDLDKIPLYLQSVVEEIRRVEEPPSRVDSLYFGGGTPSLLEPVQVGQLVDAVCRRFDVAAGTEITLEVNPGTVSHEKLSGYRRAGVNRLNIGVQSFRDASLGFLSRIHTADQAVQCVEMARSAGFDNIGLDLIYGLPGQTVQQWQADLQSAVDLRPEHLSCYMLTYEPGTRLTLDLKENRNKALPEGAVGALYELTVAYLADHGLPQYEVSNFSTATATRSRHNQKYWIHAPYIGLGPSAHSFVNNRRRWNVRSVDGYLRQIQSGQSPTEGSECLDRQQLMMEAIYLGLRCVDGIGISGFENRFHADFKTLFGPLVTEYASDGYLEAANGRCRLTRRGMLFSDTIAARFIQRI